MSLSSFFYQRVSGQVTSLSNRIYPNVLPQASTFPAVVYMIVDSVPVHAMKITSGTGMARVQIDIYSPDYDESDSIKDQVIAALSRHTDLSNTPVVNDTKQVDHRSMYEDELELHRQIIDFKILITE